jgi:hypothetical protein
MDKHLISSSFSPLLFFLPLYQTHGETSVMTKMQLLLPFFLFILPQSSLAALNGRCTGSKATGEWKESGICIKTSTCAKYKGKTKTGACPYDPDNVKCCIIDECSGSPEGLLNHSWCDWTGANSICNDFGRWLDSEYYYSILLFEGKGRGNEEEGKLTAVVSQINARAGATTNVVLVHSVRWGRGGMSPGSLCY